MRIRPIAFSEYYSGKTAPKSTPEVSDVNFFGTKQPLTAITAENFKTESAKKMFSQINKMFKRTKQSGNINDVKIFSDELKFYNRYTGEDFKGKVDILMSIKKVSGMTLLSLDRMYSNKRKHRVLQAEFDENGQMIKGQYMLGHLRFERNMNNLRRMYIDDNAILPDGSNDRAWGLSSDILPPGQRHSDNSSTGMLELFIELARLHTTLYN